jgi:hypothetical protein
VIRQDPECDFSNLIPGTSGYLKADFQFSHEWDQTKRVAGFYSNLGREYPPQELENGRTCVIPSEALKRSVFKVQVIGSKNGLKLQTNKVIVHQNGG